MRVTKYHLVSVSTGRPKLLIDIGSCARVNNGSTQQLLNIIEHLRCDGPVFDELFGGCLCVVNPSIDGGELVDWFVSHGFNSFDFLLPDGNRINPPQDWGGVNAYTQFFLSAFERWYSLGTKAPRIRKFRINDVWFVGW